MSIVNEFFIELNHLQVGKLLLSGWSDVWSNLGLCIVHHTVGHLVGRWSLLGEELLINVLCLLAKLLLSEVSKLVDLILSLLGSLSSGGGSLGCLLGNLLGGLLLSLSLLLLLLVLLSLLAQLNLLLLLLLLVALLLDLLGLLLGLLLIYLLGHLLSLLLSLLRIGFLALAHLLWGIVLLGVFRDISVLVSVDWVSLTALAISILVDIGTLVVDITPIVVPVVVVSAVGLGLIIVLGLLLLWHRLVLLFLLPVVLLLFNLFDLFGLILFFAILIILTGFLWLNELLLLIITVVLGSLSAQILLSVLVKISRSIGAALL